MSSTHPHRTVQFQLNIDSAGLFRQTIAPTTVHYSTSHYTSYTIHLHHSQRAGHVPMLKLPHLDCILSSHAYSVSCYIIQLAPSRLTNISQSLLLLQQTDHLHHFILALHFIFNGLQFFYSLYPCIGGITHVNFYLTRLAYFPLVFTTITTKSLYSLKRTAPQMPQHSIVNIHIEVPPPHFHCVPHIRATKFVLNFLSHQNPSFSQPPYSPILL